MNSVMETYRRWPLEISSASGAHVTDPEGRSYLDFVAGIAVCSVGHCHPRVTEAIAAQAGALVHVSNLYHTAPQRDLAERLAGMSGGMHSFFCNSGAEAIEAALKLARRWGSAHDRGPRIVAAEGSFHGRTLGALSVTGQPSKRSPFEPLIPAVTHVPYGDIDALKATLDEDVCAILLEPLQGEAGVIEPPAGYLLGVRQMCDEWGVLLVLDEVQTGMGRTGAWFAHQHVGVAPDVMCLAKALAGGLPMGACLARPEVAAAFAPGDHASTFGGGPVQAAAALAVIGVIESEGCLENAVVMGRRLAAGLEEAFGSGAEVRGMGLLLGVELAVERARDVAAAALALGLLVNDATPSVVRVCPPLNVTAQEVDEATAILKEAGDAL